MKNPQRRILGKLVALFLALTVCLAPAASALTADQFKILLGDYYLDGVSDAVLKEDTIEDVLKALNDPYTSYFTAEEYQAFLNGLSDQEITGIGIGAIAKENGLLIQSVFDGSPANQLGLKAGDIIIEVDGKVAAGQNAETVTQWLKGKADTTVAIKILHEDGQTEEYTAVRKVIVIPSVSAELLDDEVGYLNCKSFGPQTLQHFLDVLQKYQDAKVWMVDLRSNLGGDVSVASQTLGTFLGKGDVAYLRNGRDQYVVYQSVQEAKAAQPTIILTSSYTASAAEIFSGVMRDREHGLLIGEKTYGKGVAQVMLNSSQYPSYFSDGDAVKITAYRYFTPNGTTADHVGIIPHILVDAMSADEIALLLSETAPTQQNKNDYLCIQIRSQSFYLRLSHALKEENKAYFTQLLEALPPQAVIKRGTVYGTYENVTVSDLRSQYQLTDFHSRCFTDVEGTPYGEQINTLATYGMLKGNGSGSFSPKASMTRAELCALLAQALSLPSNGNKQLFSDVSEDAWYADVVGAATKAGLMDGVGNGAFDPEGSVTEEQLITVLARAETKLNTYFYEIAKTYDESKNSVPSTYSDWAKKSVWLLSESQEDEEGTVNLLFAAPFQINPKQNASREEAATILYNILSLINILPV
jgi:C-terminal peptidase prc